MNKKNVLITALAIAGFAVTSLAQTVPNYVPSNGLVGWWPFNGNAVDESSNTNDGTVNGATLTADRFGNANSAYSFDGVNDNINPLQNNLPVNTSNRTVSFWFQRIGIGGCILSYGTASTSNAYMISIGSNIISNQGWADDFPVYPLIDNNWHHLTCTFDGLNSTIYFDSNLLGSGPMSNWNTIAGSFYFGTRVLNDMAFFAGKIDEIAIWNRVLTPSEITGLYNGNVCFQTITVTDTLLINTNITGFNPVTYQNTIKIWPNPTNDHITIDNGNLANLTGHQIKISNALGQQVFQSAITQQQFYVDMSTWGGNGIYFVNLINAQGVTIETRKIVLQ